MNRARITACLALSVALLATGLVLASTPRLHAGQEQGDLAEIELHVDAGQSKLHWTVGSTLHTVHGTFAVKSSIIRLDLGTGKAGGEIVVDATSGESGSEGRDKRMHKEIIESGKYRDIVFRPDHVEGKITLQGGVTTQMHGMFLLHGTEHELTVPVQAEMAGDHWKGTGKFSVPYIAWGLKNPSNFLLKVDPAVEVSLELAGSVDRKMTP